MRIGFENSIVIRPTGEMSNLLILGGSIFFLSFLTFFLGGVQSKLTPPMLTVSVCSAPAAASSESSLFVSSLGSSSGYSSSFSSSFSASSSFGSSSFTGSVFAGSGGIIMGGFGKTSIDRSNSAGSLLSLSFTLILIGPTGTLVSSLMFSTYKSPF